MSQIKVLATSLAYVKSDIDQRDRLRRTLLERERPSEARPTGTPAERIPWEQRACQGMDTALFFAEGETRKACRDACARCVVRKPCLERALENEKEQGYAFGYVGGETSRSRQTMLSANVQATRGTAYAEAVRLVQEDGLSIAQAHKQTGVAWITIKRRLRPEP